MNQSLEEYRDAFQNEEVRYAVAEDFLSGYIAAQIKELRGDRSQQEIADLIGTKQSGISRLENVNYSAWEAETLRKLARAYGLRLRISFEEFGTLLTEMANFNKEALKRRPFVDDPVFKESFHKRKRRKIRSLGRVIATGHTMRKRKRQPTEIEAKGKPPVPECERAMPETRAAGGAEFYLMESGNNNSVNSNLPVFDGNCVISGNSAYGK
jgi:transcriptional regulator with XRE-family HTH domain